MSWIKKLDSLYSALTGLGGAGDKDQTTVLQGNILLTRTELEVLYRESDYAGTIVDEIVTDALRRGWRVEMDGAPDTDAYRDDMEALTLPKKIGLADKWARLYGGAAILLGIDDGRMPHEPVDFQRVRGIKYATVVNMYELRPATYDTDFTSATFDEVLTYNLYPENRVATESQPGVVHADRVLRIDGLEIPPNLAAQNDYWGDSVLQRAWAALRRFDMAEQGAGHIINEYSVAVWRIAGLDSIVTGPKGNDLFLRRVATANKGKSLINAVIIDKEREDFTRTTMTLTGLSDLWDRFAQSLASASKMPMTKLFGQAPGGLSTDDKAGRENWNNIVSGHQREVLTPILRQVVDLYLARDGVDTNYEIVWLPLDTPTEDEEASTEKTKAETRAIYIDRNVVAPTEVRAVVMEEMGIQEAPPTNTFVSPDSIDVLIDSMHTPTETTDPDDAKDDSQSDAHKRFESRTYQHIGRVIMAARKLGAAYPDIAEHLEGRARAHDASKFKNPELAGYILINERYSGNLEQPTADQEALMAQATGYHIRVNAHHPEAWETPNDMSPVDLAEMVCDWHAMAQEVGGSAREWAAKNVGTRWAFDDDHKAVICKYIETLEDSE